MKKGKTLLKLFLSMLYISTFTFGGGFVIVTFMKRKFVDELHWLEEDEMLDLVAIAQSCPGPIAVNGAIVVSTPQQVAVADVRRGVNMFRAEGIDVPVLGIIENMAWFTPAELPNNRYYLFGKGGARNMARTEGIDFLGDIPIVQSVMEGGENGTPAVSIHPEVKKYYREIADKIVEKLEKTDR